MLVDCGQLLQAREHAVVRQFGRVFSPICELPRELATMQGNSPNWGRYVFFVGPMVANSRVRGRCYELT